MSYVSSFHNGCDCWCCCCDDDDTTTGDDDSDGDDDEEKEEEEEEEEDGDDYVLVCFVQPAWQATLTSRSSARI